MDRKRIMIVATACIAVVMIVTGVVMTVMKHRDNRPAGEITNIGSGATTTQAVSSTAVVPSTVTSAGPGTAGVIDQNITVIQNALDKAFDDLWLTEVGRIMFETLGHYGITPDMDSFKTMNGEPLFGLAESGTLLIAGWQAEPFKCDLTGPNVYTCTMKGDWGTAPMPLSGADWDRALSDIRQLMSTQVHGPNGSEREMQSISVTITMDDAHNTGTIALVDGKKFYKN